MGHGCMRTGLCGADSPIPNRLHSKEVPELPRQFPPEGLPFDLAFGIHILNLSGNQTAKPCVPRSLWKSAVAWLSGSPGCATAILSCMRRCAEQGGLLDSSCFDSLSDLLSDYGDLGKNERQLQIQARVMKVLLRCLFPASELFPKWPHFSENVVQDQGTSKWPIYLLRMCFRSPWVQVPPMAMAISSPEESSFRGSSSLAELLGKVESGAPGAAWAGGLWRGWVRGFLRKYGHGSKSETLFPVNISILTKIGSKLGGEFTYHPKWTIGFDPQPYGEPQKRLLLLALGRWAGNPPSKS